MLLFRQMEKLTGVHVAAIGLPQRGLQVYCTAPRVASADAPMFGRSPLRKSFLALMTSVGCIHVFGLFAQDRMAAGPDEVRRPAL